MTTKFYTTLSAIKSYIKSEFDSFGTDPLKTKRFNLLKKNLRNPDVNAEIPLLKVLESNGFDDAIWCLCTVKGFNKEKRLFSVFCARLAQHLLLDRDSIECINVAERFANGEATKDELLQAKFKADEISTRLATEKYSQNKTKNENYSIAAASAAMCAFCSYDDDEIAESDAAAYAVIYSYAAVAHALSVYAPTIEERNSILSDIKKIQETEFRRVFL